MRRATVCGDRPVPAGGVATARMGVVIAKGLLRGAPRPKREIA